MAPQRRHHHQPSPPPSPPPPSDSPPPQHPPHHQHHLHHRENGHSLPLADQLRATLSTTLPLLDAFCHRHRNQHRASAWWSTFGMFRRSLARLARAVECPMLSGNKRHGIDNVRTRVAWLNSHLLPRAYVAFSQLMTDNQHAPLGLLLLALLGQVHAACAKWSPPDKRPVAQPQQITRIPRQGEQSSNVDGCHAEAIDKGMIISRETFVDVESHTHTITPTKREHKLSKVTARPTTKGSEGFEKGKAKKRNKKKEDTLSSLFGSLA
ncbi:hypothetical protein E4U41_003942 [Claviceps citrina]|nr:hypothetical protein E4U41_003942 [Claviceps citrina]